MSAGGSSPAKGKKKRRLENDAPYYMRVIARVTLARRQAGLYTG